MKLTKEQRELVKNILKVHYLNLQRPDIAYHGDIRFADECSQIHPNIWIIDELLVTPRFCIIACRGPTIIMVIDLLKQTILDEVKRTEPLMFHIDDKKYIYADSDWCEHVWGGLFVEVDWS